MNWLKRIPTILVSVAIAAIPIVLIFQKSMDEKHTPQILGGIGIAMIISLGLASLFFQLLWKPNPKSVSDLAIHLCGILGLAGLSALLCVLAVMSWPPSGIAVFVILWESAYVFVKPISDGWLALR